MSEPQTKPIPFIKVGTPKHAAPIRRTTWVLEYLDTFPYKGAPEFWCVFSYHPTKAKAVTALAEAKLRPGYRSVRLKRTYESETIVEQHDFT